jgi:hypothetical protein
MNEAIKHYEEKRDDLMAESSQSLDDSEDEEEEESEEDEDSDSPY